MSETGTGTRWVEAFTAHSTAAISDALDLRGVNGGLAGLARLSGSRRVAGPAYTVRLEPVGPGESAPAADYLDDVPAGAVVVLANGGRTYCTVWGDILSVVAGRRGVAGTVIDGCCRDLDAIRELDYPVWARAAYMKSGKNRVRLAAVQEPVHIGATPDAGPTVIVAPGDLVCADGSGVIVVPAGLTAEVAADLDRIAAMEAAVLADVAAGYPLREARARNGYHQVAHRATATP
jgi:regulator of RNase E activity RraA